MLPLGRRCLRVLLILLMLGLPAKGAFALSVDELVEFLESDVPEDLIVRLLDASGPPESLTPGDVVALWQAGASDRLLDKLIPRGQAPEEPPARRVEPAPAAPPSAPEAGIRAYYREDPLGGQVFILTNLDDDGQRLDGKPSSGPGKNRVTSRPWQPPPAVPEAPPPESVAPEPPAMIEPAPPAHPVYYPGGGASTFVQTSPYYGFFYGLPASYLYPPGSHTHYKLYHRSGNRPGLGHYQLPAGQIFYQPPFPTAGTHRPRRSRR